METFGYITALGMLKSAFIFSGIVAVFSAYKLTNKKDKKKVESLWLLVFVVSYILTFYAGMGILLNKTSGIQIQMTTWSKI